MDSHVADDKLKELHIEDTTVRTNRDAMQYEIDPAAEKKLLRKIDLHVVPILWFLFMYVTCLTRVSHWKAKGRSLFCAGRLYKQRKCRFYCLPHP